MITVSTKVLTLRFGFFPFEKRRFIPILCLTKKGQVAQLVEQRTENPCVGGSIPSLSTPRNGSFLEVAPDMKYMSTLFFLLSTFTKVSHVMQRIEHCFRV